MLKKANVTDKNAENTIKADENTATKNSFIIKE